MVGSMPTRAIYFTLYSNCKRFYTNFMTQNSNGVHFVSAMTAGLLTSTITSPIWVVKTQLQLDNRYHYTCNSWREIFESMYLCFISVYSIFIKLFARVFFPILWGFFVIWTISYAMCVCVGCVESMLSQHL